MKIGFDTTILVEENKTGIGNYIYNLINSLIKSNSFEIYSFIGIIPLKSNFYIKNPIFNKININIKTYRIPSRLWHSIFTWWQRFSFPPIEFLVGNVDVFHSFDWYFPPSRSCKRVATVFDVSPLTHPEGHTEANIRQHVNRLNAIKKGADFVLTISKASKNEIIRTLNIPEEKIDIAYPGVNTEEFFPRKDKKLDKVLLKYDLKPGFILFVSSWYPRKNILRLLDAFKLLQAKNKFSNKLVLIGRQTSMMNKLSLGKNVLSLGYVPQKDLPFFYNGAKMLVYPSLYEGFGIPLIEAMASGCPVVTSNISSMPEVVGNAGILVNPFKKEEIFNGMEKILKNKALEERLKAAGLKRVKQFTWENCAKKTISAYERLVK